MQRCQVVNNNASGALSVSHCSPKESAAGDLSTNGICSSPLSFLVHVLTTGTAILALGVISGLTCAILVLKSHSKLHSNDNDNPPHDESNTVEEIASNSKHSTFLLQRSNVLPLEAMGLSYNSHFLLSALGSMLKKVAPLMESLAGSVNEALLTISVCLPIGLYYITWIQLARINPQVIVSL